MSFLDIRFPDNISYGAVGGPAFSTDVVVINSGFEQRNANWAEARCSYDVSHAARTTEQMNELVSFFRVAQGRANSFRYKDWFDYKVSPSEGILSIGAIGDGTSTYQLYKRYSNAAGSNDRKITRPLSGQVSIFRNASPVTIGTGAGNVSIDYDTGIVTFVADVTKNINGNSVLLISNITKSANAIVTTATPHGFISGDKIKIETVGGMTQVNNLYFTITVIDSTNFELNVNSSGYTTYTSQGTATKYSITQTNPVRVYSTGHGIANSKEVYISSVGGMTALNGNLYTVINSSTDYFDLQGVDGTAFPLKTSGGILQLFPQPTDTLTWSGQYDIAARFDVDQIKANYIAPDVLGWDSIPVVEVRE